MFPFQRQYDSITSRHSSSLAQQSNDSVPYNFLDIEIDDHGIRACQTGLCYSDDADIVLLKYHEIPDFLKGNPYVVKGYRSLLPFSMCMKSLLLWTNETINIWSHFGGFFIFLLLILWDNLITLPQMHGSLSDHIIITIGLSCFMFCMSCSTVFHIFCCHSERASRRLLALDMTGVSVGIIGCYLPAVHYAFFCLSVWRDIYMMIVIILSGCILVFQLHPRFFTSKWFFIRMAVYTGLAAYGIIPACHWIYLSGGLRSEIVQIFAPKITTMYMIGLLAFVFYISKIPERIFPGKCCFIGSSHQIWHVLIVAAFLYWHKAGEEILSYRISHECPA